jgi:hypothetical protein
VARQAHRHLGPNGLFIFDTPAPGLQVMFLVEQTGQYRVTEWQPGRRHYTYNPRPEDVQALCDAVGFLRVAYIHYLLPHNHRERTMYVLHKL